MAQSKGRPEQRFKQISKQVLLYLLGQLFQPVGLTLSQPFSALLRPGLAAALLFAVCLLPVINPAQYTRGATAGSDFVLIAFNPGSELLSTGRVNLDYPYPLWTVVVLLPFVLLGREAGIILWLVCNQIMLGISFVLLLRAFGWKLPRLVYGLLIVLAAYFLPTLTSLWLGQLTIFSLFLLALTMDFYLRGDDWGLGVVVGLSFIKPQTLILLAGLLLLWALWQRRWRVWIGFGCVVGFLALISLPFIAVPAQMIGGGIGGHLFSYIKLTSTLWAILMILGAPWWLPLGLSLLLLAWLGLAWLPLLRGAPLSDREKIYLFAMTALVNLMVIPYSWMHNLILLLLPLALGVELTRGMPPAWRYTWLAVLLAIMQPVMLETFFLFNRRMSSQAFQILPALLLFPLLYGLMAAARRRALIPPAPSPKYGRRGADGLAV